MSGAAPSLPPSIDSDDGSPQWAIVLLGKLVLKRPQWVGGREWWKTGFSDWGVGRLRERKGGIERERNNLYTPFRPPFRFTAEVAVCSFTKWLMISRP